MKQLLKGIFKELGIEYQEEHYDKFDTYASLLIEWNKKFNLTGITDLRDIYIKHFGDSLLLYEGIKATESLIDVGSGAGFPGIPLKIAGYKQKTVLLEANGKKASFLELDNIFVCNKRAENAAREEAYRELFDVVVARAVAPLSILLEYCVPFIKREGIFIAMKTDNSELQSAENAMKQLSVEILKEDKQTIPFSDIKRNNMYFKKTRNTAYKYPRPDGVPKKKPL
ncbi:MAG TPA: 16S rRNA (guanine(527)-N(7))-methyltransferase RsmG [Clostridia bacterium]|nr:16S rRNA (guanine(527)-N(7))-methyltransferase RsmG [Clostridia bacterium]HQF99347.1 16S rRNA (guanine(527)-N(7))-methyltransferase RsmG [Clostridia bacterium]HQH65611.1 16S rRNA (guanine(527)-N(7))-methyltransferase RsmG [Clostridia bacterium]HQJ92394.1 16S rRNA (guanine(527)-N(7))-methyltransferase RsmG [Clostridia bacterium]HRU59193.1 16S rRNA (guanine(527)-N(7))-methyltransferase RsmG [Clostridia bacterium]